MQDSPYEIIVDTNLWISFLISGNSQLDELLFSGKVKLIFSTELMDEFLRVALRPKFEKFFKRADVAMLLRTIQEYASLHIVSSQVSLCRDPKDDFLLALALDSNADFLVTGDKDLLEIGQIGHTKIIMMAEFLQIIA